LNYKDDVYKQEFSVSFDYPVYFSRSIFDKDNSAFADVINRKRGNLPHRIIVFIDSGVIDAYPRITTDIQEYFQTHSNIISLSGSIQIISGGENAKTGWGDVRKIMTLIGDQHLDRQSFVVAIGGGSVQDMVGFAASLVHRGLRFVRVPTTVLAQNDAGVGVKNGMNEREVKNYVGSFAPPWAVFNDFNFLSTLNDRDWVGGIAEAFKVSIIKDREFFKFLCENAKALADRNVELMEELIRRCAVMHLEHIRNSGDPFEFGSSRPLDFGHWSAHKLETLSDFSLGHGQAVSIGIALDSYCASKMGLITSEEVEQVHEGLKNSGLPVWSKWLLKHDIKGKLEILNGLGDFREHLGGILTLAMPKGIGNQCEINNLDEGLILEAVDYLQNKFET